MLPRWMGSGFAEWSSSSTYSCHHAQDPAAEKFRRIKVSNATFHIKVASVPGALDFLQVLGFESVSESGEQFLVMGQDKASMPAMNTAGAELQSALTNPFFGVL